MNNIQDLKQERDAFLNRLEHLFMMAVIENDWSPNINIERIPIYSLINEYETIVKKYGLDPYWDDRDSRLLEGVLLDIRVGSCRWDRGLVEIIISVENCPDNWVDNQRLFKETLKLKTKFDIENFLNNYWADIHIKIGKKRF
tara:strand:- start:49 stop:474 length:426 start_codon:yes stop_codon:yes gene_type:complete